MLRLWRVGRVGTRPLMTFEGHVTTGKGVSDEEKLAKIFGGRLKGESPKPRSTSRYLTEEQPPRLISGVKVPHRPHEPDNCCMSGCVNCVWEYYNEDIRHWQQRRRAAVEAISRTHDMWPLDWDPPISLLPLKNLPKQLHQRKLEMEREKETQSMKQLQKLFPPRDKPLPQSVIDAKKRNLLKRQQQESQDDEGWNDVPIYIKVFAQFERRKRLQRQREKLRDHN